MKFQGLEIRPFSQVTALRPVRIDRLRVEVRRTLFGEIEYDLVGTMGGGGEGFPVCRPFERLEDVWPEKDKLEAAIQAARWDDTYRELPANEGRALEGFHRRVRRALEKHGVEHGYI